MMLIDVDKFNEIVLREQLILKGLKEPELHWYSQNHVIKILEEVGSLIKEETHIEVPAKTPAKKVKAKVTSKDVNEDGDDN